MYKEMYDSVCFDSLIKSRANKRIGHFVGILPYPGPIVNPALLVPVCSLFPSRRTFKCQVGIAVVLLRQLLPASVKSWSRIFASLGICESPLPIALKSGSIKSSHVGGHG